MAKAITVKVDEKAGVATITVPLGKAVASKSGKSMVVASTNGNVPAGASYKGNELTLGLNLYYKADAE